MKTRFPVSTATSLPDVDVNESHRGAQSSLPGVSSFFRSDHRAAEPVERLAQLGIVDLGELAVERGGLAEGEWAGRLPYGPRLRQGQRALDQRQPGHRRA